MRGQDQREDHDARGAELKAGPKKNKKQKTRKNKQKGLDHQKVHFSLSLALVCSDSPSFLPMMKLTAEKSLVMIIADAAYVSPWTTLWAFGALAMLLAMAIVPGARELVRTRLKGGLPRPPVWSTGFPVIGTFLAFASNPVGTVRRARDELGGPECFSLSLVGRSLGAHTHLYQAQTEAPSFFKQPQHKSVWSQKFDLYGRRESSQGLFRGD